jgi:WhiB family redox-sensing transcriptional regulator
MEDAKCRELSPADADDLFYNEAPGVGATAAARRYCRGLEDRRPCPVQAECLQLALDTDSRFGVWAGISERGRRYMHRDVARDARNDRKEASGE